jgi:predicted TIM-barrel fold metal-dependent hydrolase
MRIDIGGKIGRFGDLNYTESGLARHAATCKLDHICVANVAAASASVGGEDCHEADANTAVLELARLHPRYLPLYWLRPGQVDHNPYAVAGALSTEPFAGLMLAPEWNDFALDELNVAPILKVAQRLRLPVFVQLGTGLRAGTSAVLAIARRYPRIRWVLRGGTSRPLFQATVDLFRRTPNDGDVQIFVDTCGLDPDRVVPLIRAVGADRILFATDAGLETEAARVAGFELFHAIERAIPGESARKILGDNAAAVLENLRAFAPRRPEMAGA